MKPRDLDRADYGCDTSLSDTVFIAALGFFLLFLAAFLMIRPPTEADKAVKLRAEFVLTMTWPDGAYDDIDLWIMLPDGQKVWFARKDVEHVTIDRDDLGALNDFYTDASGQRSIQPGNRELATVRAIVPGRYVVAAHVYAARETVLDFYAGGKTWSSTQRLPYQATLEVVKLNPHLKEVLKAKVDLSERGQEAVFAAFDVDADGNVGNIEMNPTAYKVVDLVPLWGEGVR